MTWNDMEYQAIKILLIWKFPKMGIPPKQWVLILKWSNDLDDLGYPHDFGNHHVVVDALFYLFRGLLYALSPM
jgi:hypothetical protein